MLIATYRQNGIIKTYKRKGEKIDIRDVFKKLETQRDEGSRIRIDLNNKIYFYSNKTKTILGFYDKNLKNRIRVFSYSTMPAIFKN